MKNTIKIKISYISILILSICFCSIASCSIPLFATGDAGNEGGNNSSGGNNDCKTQTIGHCNGGGWVYQQWPAGHEGDIVIPNYGCQGSYCFMGGIIPAICKETGGYWRSAWFRSGNPNDLIGLAQNYNWKPMGIPNLSWHTYNVNAADFNVVYDQFKKAEERGDVPADVNWNNASWFCSTGMIGDDPKPVSGTTSFYSTSTVKIGDSEITGGKTVTTKRDGEAMVKFSTDKSSVTVEFSHTVGYDHGDFTMNPEDTASGGAVNTDWNVTGAYTAGRANWGPIRPGDNNSTTPDSARRSVTIDFGDSYGTKKKCSQIDYNHKNANLTGTWVCDQKVCSNQGCTCSKGHYDYTATYNDRGSSKVCVEVTRPEPPSGEPQNPGGNANSQVMFVGEDAAIQWNNIHAQSEETRRLSGWQSIKFQVGANVPYNQENFKVADVKADPCSMYRARFGITDSSLCVVHESGSWDTATSSKHSHDDYKGKEAYIKVPDYVGYKYCHSFGYSLEYWYGIEGSENAQENGWHHDAPKDYWHNFSAACRTIAKKPTTATWNGNVMTMGNIITSLANRHNSIIFGETSDAGDKSYTLYGSWSEYLTIANAELNSKRTIASGSTLSLGSANAELCKNGQSPWESNSPLTIANIDPLNPSSCKLSPSGVASNTTFITRLNAYLRDVGNKNGITPTNNINDLYGEIQGNVVLSVEGDLNIDQNIIINDNNEYTINNVPQAIIFVKNGNVNIAENVSRIDAWLIVTASDNSKGTINTCANFTPGAPNSANVTSDGVGFNGSRCTKQLAFNGPVIARSMNLQRTYGSEAIDTQRQGTFSGIANSKQAPAEIFNLRADSYLWAYAQAARYNSSYSEAYSRELAPRY